jgi:hypothetical protein
MINLTIVESKKNSTSGFWHYADSFSYAPSGAVTDTSASPNPANNVPDTGNPPEMAKKEKKEHTIGARPLTHDKHTKPRPGRPTTKDREQWDRVWKPKKK